MHTTFTIQTTGPGLYEFTSQVADWTSAHADGLLTLFIRHTSASLLIQENADAKVQDDLQSYFHRLVPPASDPKMAYLTHTVEGPDDMPAHIKAALTATSLSIPILEGELVLGTWQGIFLWEHRESANSREVVVHISAS